MTSVFAVIQDSHDGFDLYGVMATGEQAILLVDCLKREEERRRYGFCHPEVCEWVLGETTDLVSEAALADFRARSQGGAGGEVGSTP